MILAPSRRQLLNGSKFLLVVLSLFVAVASCTPSKKIQKTKSVPNTRQDGPEMVRVYDPATDSYVLRPVEDLKIDTITWTNDPRPPVIEAEGKEVKKDEKGTKGKVSDIEEPLSGITNIAVILPLNTESEVSRSQSRDSRFLQFYAGMRIGFEEIENPERFNINIYHSADSNQFLANQINTSDLGFPDIIIGPYDRSSIEALIPKVAENEAILISPWLPSFMPKLDAPFLLQLTPGLNRHAERIMAYVEKEMSGQKVVIVIRDTPSERKRAELFKSVAKRPVEEFIINDKTSALADTDVLPYLADEGTVFILPYYSRSDEAFVNSFMRKVHADRLEKPVTIFGLPQWSGFSNLNTNYMESLSLHITEPFFTESESKSLDIFRGKFFDKYFTVPDINAYQGYDLAKWIDQSISASSGTLKERLLKDWTEGLSSSLHFVPSFRSETDMTSPAYMENAGIHIVRFLRQDFQLVE